MSDRVPDMIKGAQISGAAAARNSNPFLDHARSEGEFEDDIPMRVGMFRYVAYAQIDDYHKAGWMVIAELGAYSVLMWRCECDD